MHRIDSNGAANGQWQAGNPAIGQRATQIPADWMNAVQEAICHVIETAGIELTKGDDTQLYDAIIALIAGVVGDGSGAVPTVRQVLTGGLATGGGDLAANRTITVPKATSGEVTAQVRDDVAVTPASLAGLVSFAWVAGGLASALVVRVGQVIIQVFDGVAQPNTTTILNLPQTYPSNNRGAWVNGGGTSPNQQDNGPWVSGRGVSTVSVYNSIDAQTTVTVITIGV